MGLYSGRQPQLGTVRESDVVRELRGDRPNVNLDDPDVPIVAVLLGNSNGNGAQLSLYRQLHGPGSLHKRGYRTVHNVDTKIPLRWERPRGHH